MTETKTLNRDTPTDHRDDKPAEPKRLLDLSASQLVGGALAAMTSAVVGAQLGVAGTILGAALGSIIAGVAGTLYTVSLKRTKDKIASAFVGRVGDTKVELTTLSEEAVSGRSVTQSTVTEDTAELGGWDWDATATQPAAAAPPSPQPVATAASVGTSGKPAVRLPWKPLLVSTAAVFLLAIAGITGFELVSGQAISGGQGTTVTQVGDGGSGSSDTPSEEPSAEPSTEPSSSSEPSASSEPSPSATTEPSAEASQSTEPSASAEPSASSEPTSSTTPSTPSDEESAATSGDEEAGAGG